MSGIVANGCEIGRRERDILGLDVGFSRKITVVVAIDISRQVQQILLRRDLEGVRIRTFSATEQFRIEGLHSVDDSCTQGQVLGAALFKLPAVRAIDLQGEASGIELRGKHDIERRFRSQLRTIGSEGQRLRVIVDKRQGVVGDERISRHALGGRREHEVRQRMTAVDLEAEDGAEVLEVQVGRGRGRIHRRAVHHRSVIDLGGGQRNLGPCFRRGDGGSRIPGLEITRIGQSVFVVEKPVARVIGIDRLGAAVADQNGIPVFPTDGTARRIDRSLAFFQILRGGLEGRDKRKRGALRFILGQFGDFGAGKERSRDKQKSKYLFHTHPTNQFRFH